MSFNRRAFHPKFLTLALATAVYNRAAGVHSSFDFMAEFQGEN
jgi:hypothetical protein